MNEDCKREIEDYVKSQGWFNLELFNPDAKGVIFICESYFCYSKKGADRNLMNKYGKPCRRGDGEMSKYLLEYIGHILRKHNIKIIKVRSMINSLRWGVEEDKSYTSDNWKLNNIFETLTL